MRNKIIKYLATLVFILTPFLCLSQEGVLNNYYLGPGDTIEIQVYAENDLDMEVILTDTGDIDYPYLGLIQVQGKTTAQIKKEIESGLRGDYLIDPKVMVRITQFRQIYVNGEVQRPGGYTYQPGLTVGRAIALAGGFTVRAKRESVGITSSGNSQKQSQVELDKKIKPGDIIIVDPTFF